MKFVPQTVFYSRTPQGSDQPVQFEVMMFHGLRSPHESIGPFVPRFWVLDYSFSEGSDVRVGNPGNPWWARPKYCGHIYPPGVRYWERVSRELPGIFCSFISFRGGEFLGFDRLVENEYHFCRFLDEDGIVYKFLRNWAIGLQQHSTTGFLHCQANLYLLAEELSRLKPTDLSWQWQLRPEDAEETQSREFIGRVKQHLLDNYWRKLSLDDIAEALRVSRSSLTHRYFEIAGETPWKTLTRIRLNAAKIMLLQNGTLHKIALQTGFSDEFYLSRVFKKEFGMSPREFRSSQGAGRSD